MRFYVIEHKTRGWFTGNEYEPLKEGGYGWVPHFAWSVTAKDDRVHRMFSNQETKCELQKMPERIRLSCTVKELKT